MQDLASLLKKLLHYIAFIIHFIHFIHFFHWLILPNVTLDLFVTGHVWGATKLVHGWCVQASLYFGQGGVGQNEMEGNHHPDLRQRLDPTSSIPQIPLCFLFLSLFILFIPFHFPSRGNNPELTLCGCSSQVKAAESSELAELYSRAAEAGLWWMAQLSRLYCLKYVYGTSWKKTWFRGGV